MTVISRTIALAGRHRILTAILAVLIVAVGVVDVRIFVVPTSDKPRPTDAIVVLGGDTYQTRLRAAARLAREYPGTPLVVSTPGHNPCPRSSRATTQVFCFRPDPSTTQGEARAATELAVEHGWTSITVVTTADQVWRARLRFSRCWSGELHVVQAPTSTWVRLRSVPYEMGATVKAELLQRSC
jgi:uncharacterized SAM-binding protein YcdF (DUF218 family)